MSWMADFNFLIARGDMRGAGDACMKKGAHGGNMAVSRIASAELGSVLARDSVEVER